MKTFRVFTSWLMAIICLGLVAGCSNDDEEVATDNPLLGTWVYEDAALEYEDIVTFNADGTCKLVVKYMYGGANVSTKTNATYVYEDNLITIIPENGNAISWRVLSITSQSLTLTRNDVEGQPSVTYHKV